MAPMGYVDFFFAFFFLAAAAALEALVALILRCSAFKALARALPPALAIRLRSALMAAAIWELRLGSTRQVLHRAKQEFNRNLLFA